MHKSFLQDWSKKTFSPYHTILCGIMWLGCSSRPDNSAVDVVATPPHTVDSNTPAPPSNSALAKTSNIAEPADLTSSEQFANDDNNETGFNAEFDASLESPDLELLNPDSIVEFDRESGGQYSKKDKQSAQCTLVPLNFVWREFAPFFDYKWNDDFRDFAALFLAIWRSESNFKKPKRGVIVQPNCGKPPKVVRSVSGTDIKKDLTSAKSKLKFLTKHFKGCKMGVADYGAMQWNSRWRLRNQYYRPQIERALALTTSYPMAQIKKLNQADVAQLVKFNSNALFLLAGLSFRGVKYTTVISDYNTNPDYRERAARFRNDYIRILNTEDSCNLGEKKLVPTTYKTKNIKKLKSK